MRESSGGLFRAMGSGRQYCVYAPINSGGYCKAGSSALDGVDAARNFRDAAAFLGVKIRAAAEIMENDLFNS